MHKTIHKGFSAFLVAMLLVVSSPLPLYAEEGATTEETVQTETTQEQTTQASTENEEEVSVVETGNATSEAEVVNGVNTNETNVENAEPADGGAGANEKSATEGDSITAGDTSKDTSTTGSTHTTTDNTTKEDTSNSQGATSGQTSSKTSTQGSSTTTPHMQSSESQTVETTQSENKDGSFGKTSTTTESKVVGPKATSTVTSTNDNKAKLGNDVESQANSGDNAVSGNGDAVVATGNGTASANVVNVVNTNLFNSQGWILLLNTLFGGMNGSIDLRNVAGGSHTSGGAVQGTACDLESCSGASSELNVENNNTAEISNNVVVRANTGGNTAGSENGTAVVNTGDAYASSNVVNIANTNITDSNYLVLSFNSFGNWFGDLIFPGKELFEGYLGNTSAGANTSVTNNNTANVANNVDVTANTGGNTAQSNADGTSVVQTGDAQASSNVVNQVNTNIFGGNNVMMVFRIHGNWVGDVFGLPEGVTWGKTQDGLKIFSEGASSAPYVPSSGSHGTTTVSNTNDATINNNVSVFALTGDNQAAGKNAGVSTGNAHAVSNILNVANTNVFGKNWILAIVNIFGDWTGNVSFGRPDLWIGGRAELPDEGAWPGFPIEYTYTIVNNGDAPATNVRVIDTLDPHLYFVGSRAGTFSGGKVSWTIPTLPPNSSAEVKYIAAVSDDISYGEMLLTNSVTSTLSEQDENPYDNSDEVVITANKNNYGVGTSQVIYTPDPVLSIEKEVLSDGEITASSTVDYRIVIRNDGGTAYHSVLRDVVYNEDGVQVYKNSWDLGEIYPDEEITIDYSIFFNDSTVAGEYTNTALLHTVGRHPSLNPFYGWFFDTPEVSASIYVEETYYEEEEEYYEEEEEENAEEESAGIGGQLENVVIKRESKPAPAKATSDVIAVQSPFMPYAPFTSSFPASAQTIVKNMGLPSSSAQTSTSETFRHLAAVGAIPFRDEMWWIFLIVLLMALYLHRESSIQK